MKIFFDDLRKPPDHTWVWVDNAKGCIGLLKRFKVTHISLDHDVGDRKLYGDGYEIITWMEKEVYINDKYIPPSIIIHTANPVARQKMNAARTSILQEIARRPQ